MKHVNKDILTVRTGYILQQTNCVGTHPFGLSADIERVFTGTCPYYIRNGYSTPGTVFLIQSKIGPIIGNLFGQYYPGGPGRKGDSENDRQTYFRNCLDALVDHFIGSDQRIQIAIPYKIGCGLAQGDWNVYEKMLLDFEAKLKENKLRAELTIYHKD